MTASLCDFVAVFRCPVNLDYVILTLGKGRERERGDLKKSFLLDVAGSNKQGQQAEHLFPEVFRTGLSLKMQKRQLT